jgi:pyruvate dehydrogenase E1 component alpha subunit
MVVENKKMTVTPVLPTLGSLANSSSYIEPLTVQGHDPKQLIGQLRSMLLIRVAEEKIGDMVTAGKVKCPCHLAIGQEAVAVGVATGLRKSDRVFGAHRSHSHYLSQDGDVEKLFAEVLGKVTGCSKGMGGSMHLYDQQNGFYGSVPIVAATVSLAVGAGLAAQKDKKGDVGVSYFGDGAAEEGSVHESMNLASVFKLPVLFVCENNLFSSHLHIDLRQPSNSVARYAAAHGIPYEVVDGNDVIAVTKDAARLLERSRKGGGPGFIEAVTYRWRGHVGPREDQDVGVKRKEDLALWKRKDPIRRLCDGLIASGALSAAQWEKIKQDVNQTVETAWANAERAPFPEANALLDLVYSQE